MKVESVLGVENRFLASLGMTDVNGWALEGLQSEDFRFQIADCDRAAGLNIDP